MKCFFYFCIHLDFTDYLEFRTALKPYKTNASPQESLAIDNVLRSADLYGEYLLIGNSDGICKLLSTNGLEQAQKLEEITTQPKLRRSMSAMNAKLDAGQESLKQNCNVNYIRKFMSDNLRAFLKGQ